MIVKLASVLLRSSSVTARAAALAGLTGLALCGAADAITPGVAPSAVVSGDTFGIELVAYNFNNPADNYYAIATTLMPAFSTSGFGSTQTFANSALDGQTLSVFTSESSNNGVFTDTIRISVPTNFVPSDDSTFQDGSFVTALDFSIGLVASTGGTNPLDYTTPISLISVTGSATYSGGGIGLTQNPVLTNGNKSFSNQESVQSANNSTPISNSDVTAFSVTITYQAVPEPSTYAAVLLGAAGLFWVNVVRRRRA